MNTTKLIEELLGGLVGRPGKLGLVDIDICQQFGSGGSKSGDDYRKLNAAFLICMCGNKHPLHTNAISYMEKCEKDEKLKFATEFYRFLSNKIFEEMEHLCNRDDGFMGNLVQAVSLVKEADMYDRKDVLEKVWKVFFPEGTLILRDYEGQIEALREKRTITISRLNEQPIRNPASEILITSNVLLTVPLRDDDKVFMSLPEQLGNKLKTVMEQGQRYWYDHPIPVGISPQKNELVYGLKELDAAIAFEKDRGVISPQDKVDCVLSVSVTHEGLQELAKPLAVEMLKTLKGLQHLNVYIWSESETEKLLDWIIIPSMKKFLGSIDAKILKHTIGINGEYGRHYSFLKAIGALWQVLIHPPLKGTFKIDLDQVFPQMELVRSTRLSAFEHFKTPLWGAHGVDRNGKKVELGMIAGALVNESDIGKSLFTPDVTYPKFGPKGDEWIFLSSLPQALSTQAEMMARYDNPKLDGIHRCIQRIHVTGGTCGILIDSLRRHRPFTPSFVGRAEDQAYLLSVLFKDSAQGLLRYLHKDGLIMRHDKERLADEAIRNAETGKLVGDLIRILVFTHYAKVLPWQMDLTKAAVDPFTGCFISKLPVTVAGLRFALKLAMLFDDRVEQQAVEFMELGVKRLSDIFKKVDDNNGPLERLFRDEQNAWKIYYDVLDCLEAGLRQNDSFCCKIREKAQYLVHLTKI